MKKGAIFRTVRVFLVLAASLVIAATLVILRPKAERQVPVDKGRLVEVFAVRTEDVPMVIECYGTVAPRETLKLVAQVHGPIVEISPDFKEGNFINKQTRLIQIDPRTYALEVERRKVQIKQSEAELKRLDQEVVNLKTRVKIARSDVGLAENEYQRLKKLVSKKVIAQSQVDKAEQSYLASRERLQALENQLALIGPQREQLIAARDMASVMYQQAQLDLERSMISAPFDGWVLEKSVEVGQHVNVGQQLGSIYHSGELDIEVNLPVKDFKWLPADMGETTRISVDVVYQNSGREHVWRGHVARAKAKMDEKTRTLPLVIEVDDAAAAGQNSSGFRLRPGMFVTVKIEGRKVTDAFVLPRHVVYPGDIVYTVADNQIKIKEIDVLRSYKDSVIVAGGLSEGDRIVKTPLPGAVDGMRVRVKATD